MRGSWSGWCSFAHDVRVAGIPGWPAEGPRPGSGAPPWGGNWVAPHHRSGSQGYQANGCRDRQVDGGHGGHRETSVDEPGGHRGERETFSSQWAGFPFGVVRAHPLRRWSRNVGRRRRTQQHLNCVYHAGLGLSLNAKGDLAHPGLRTRGRARWLASLTVVLLHGGVGHREDVSGWIGGGKRSRADAVSHLIVTIPPPPPLMESYLDRVLLGFLSFKRVIRPKPPLSRALLRPHYWCVASIVSLASLL